MAETADQIAARYGAALAPGVAVQRIPRGQSARPLPVWDGRKLIIPDWKEQRQRAQAASLRAQRGRAKDPQVSARRDRVRDLHGAGKTVAEIAALVDATMVMVRKDLSELGLRANLDAGARAQKLSHAARARSAAKSELLARLVAAGVDEAEIMRQTGITTRSWLREKIAQLGAPAVDVRKRRLVPGAEPPPPSRLEAAKAEQRDLASVLQGLLDQELSYSQIGERLGMTRGTVSGHVHRMRKNGLLRPSGAEAEGRSA